MRDLPPALRWYLCTVWALALVVLGVCFAIWWSQPEVETNSLWLVVLFAAIAVVTDLNPVIYNRYYGQTVVTSILVASVFIFSPLSVVFIAAHSSYVSDSLPYRKYVLGNILVDRHEIGYAAAKTQETLYNFQ